MAIQLDLLHPVTDEELLQLSERNPGYQFHRQADGRPEVSQSAKSRSGTRTPTALPSIPSFWGLSWNSGRCSRQ
jgi:hypothetical protein